jgi:GNAT superfamily N-acetyltransferase
VAARDYTVERLQPGEDHAVVGALARAFYDDPLFGFFVPNLVRQSKGLAGFMGAGLADAKPFGEVWVARSERGKVASAAVWLPPEGYPRSKQRDVMTMVRGAPTFAAAGRRIGAAIKLLNETDRLHHEIEEPHYYLALLGTDPLYQRTGAGHAVLAPVLEKCDTQGVPAYLETQKEENIAYYARHAFDVVHKIELKGTPPVWCLLRKPR